MWHHPCRGLAHCPAFCLRFVFRQNTARARGECVLNPTANPSIGVRRSFSFSGPHTAPFAFFGAAPWPCLFILIRSEHSFLPRTEMPPALHDR